MKYLKSFIISLFVMFCIIGCSKDEDSYPSPLKEDCKIVICFDNQTNHHIYFEVNHPSWHVSNIEIQPMAKWEYTIAMKRGEQNVFILPMRACTIYVDGEMTAYFEAKADSTLPTYVPLSDKSFSVEMYKATKESVRKGVYTFTITETTVEAWKSASSRTSVSVGTDLCSF